MNFAHYITKQMHWSLSTFGAGPRTEGICKHIESELDEIREEPKDLGEWVDVMILAIDGAWRAGFNSDEIMAALVSKQATNFTRRWPAPQPEDHPTEHIRDGAGATIHAE